MKRIVLLLFLIPFITSYAQSIVYYNSVIDSGLTNGTTINFARDIFLAGIIVPDSLSDSCYFQTYDSGDWATITNEAGAIIYYKPSTSLDRALAVDPKYFYPWKIIRPVFTDKPTIRRTVKVIGKKY